ncbi:winged helix-turn-helix domain-containing protein [Kibdelosporangium philippinense]|uniref:Winged helix-turn-helix domain-containing protein n=1 Tax=Kibdelosporangium philippinense TaxID=211113 RepID=A0ABS8Z9G4_9PSEU|nr:winged helix-turn-helix domain-containing protein [Kibdelosporangium philippinense]MCE7002487.1 winged helix-turn-helix domain-containing protein [Kibdelosporangium philippinense]
MFALEVFGTKGGAAFNEWRRQVRLQLGGRLEPVQHLIAQRRPAGEVLRLLDRPGGAGTDHAARQRLTNTVFEFCQAAVIPYWEGMRDQLDAVRDARGRIAIASGVDGLLRTLHPKVRWKPPYLEVPTESEQDTEVRLGGRGLLLSPSLFLRGTACVVPSAERETGRPALVFSIPDTGTVTDGLNDRERAQEKALGALVGHTRAAALRVLTDSCTTGELSERLGISLAGASKHATVLRKAGLVTTERNRNTALHSLTSLGLALLGLAGTAPARAGASHAMAPLPAQVG